MVEEEIPVASYQNISDQQVKYQLVSTAEQRSQLITDLMQQTTVCFDTETTGLNPLTADLIGLAFCFNKNQAFYIHIPEGEEQNIADEFKVFFEKEGIEKIAQNLKYDYKVLAKYGVLVATPYFDTMLAHYLLEPDQRHSMDVMAQNYLN